VLGIGPVDGQWIEVAGLAGGRLPAATADGWQVRRTAHGVALSGPARETVAVQEAEEIRAFGFSPDGQAFVLASSPGLAVFQRDASDCRLRNSMMHFPVSGMRVARAGPSTRRSEAPACRATSREGARTQRAGTGSDDGRHSRLISP
jgi:hypothetical protein